MPGGFPGGGMLAAGIDSHIARQSDNLRLPFVKLESTKKAFFYHGCRVFNENL